MDKLYQLLFDPDNSLLLRGIILAHKHRIYLDDDMELSHYANLTKRGGEIIIDTWWANGVTRCHRGVTIYTLKDN